MLALKLKEMLSFLRDGMLMNVVPPVNRPCDGSFQLRRDFFLATWGQQNKQRKGLMVMKLSLLCAELRGPQPEEKIDVITVNDQDRRVH